MTFTAREISFGHTGGPLFNCMSFCLAPGTLNTLLGPNGSGKSTLLRAINGILPVRSGTVEYAGQDIASLKRRDLARLFSYVPQHMPATSLTVYEAVMLGRTPHMRFAPSRRDVAAVTEALAALGIKDWQYRPLNELSGGERQKVFIAMALAQQTPVILLDEPAGSLDLRQQMEAYELLRCLCRQQGKLVLAAEHDLNLAARYSDNLLVLGKGRIAAQGAPEKILTPELLREVYAIDAMTQNIPGLPTQQGEAGFGGSILNIVSLGAFNAPDAATGKNTNAAAENSGTGKGGA